MANLFWGVSDALDLYEEYINAKRQIAAKSQAPLKEKVVETSSAETVEQSSNNSTEDNIGSGDLKDPENIEDAAEAEVKGAVKKDDPSFLNAETKVCFKNNSEELCKNDPENLVKIASNKNIQNDDEDINTTLSKVDQNAQNITVSKEIAEESFKIANTSSVRNFTVETTDSKEQKNDLEQPTFESKENKVKNEEEILKKEDGKTKYEEILNDNNKSTPSTERQKAGEYLESVTNKQNDPLKDVASNEPNNTSQETFEDTKPSVLKILIFGGGDPRHIIKTMAKRYMHCENEGNASSVPILKFYVIEGCMEIVARNIVLLGIALERPELISLRNKVHLFMDVYGNSLLRPTCHQYLVSKATTLLKMVSDKETLQNIAPFIKIDSLKFREIDALQDAFEFWQPKLKYEFKIKDYWMARIRQLLTVRYDSRDGVFDWDLNMSLKSRGGQQICSQEYRYWRETGIAFTFPEYEQCKPNKTLSAGLVRNGDRYLHRGYIGDIQTGPFCTFGLRSVEERMHHSAHGQNDYRATDVTERNLLEYFHEIQNGTSYEHNDAISHKYGGVRFQMGERLIHNECDMKGICAYDKPWIIVEGIEVNFLPLEEVKKIGKGAQKWENFFDVAFVGYKFFEFVNDSFPKVLNKNSLLILETKLRSVEITNRITEFETELHGFAQDAKLLGVLNYNALNSKNSILKYWKPKN